MILIDVHMSTSTLVYVDAPQDGWLYHQGISARWVQLKDVVLSDNAAAKEHLASSSCKEDRAE